MQSNDRMSWQEAKAWLIEMGKKDRKKNPNAQQLEQIKQAIKDKK
jgi:hypothetical protein